MNEIRTAFFSKDKLNIKRSKFKEVADEPQSQLRKVWTYGNAGFK